MMITPPREWRPMVWATAPRKLTEAEHAEIESILTLIAQTVVRIDAPVVVLP